MTQIADKAGHILEMSDCTQCFASRKQGTIIDVLHPTTGLTVFYHKTLEQCRETYPDAEEMSVDEFCAWKAQQQRTPISWEKSTSKQYWDMLGAVPPAKYLGTAFLVGEPYDHDAGNGLPRYEAFRQRGRQYEVSNRPMTIPEFMAAIQ
jgi:uncharacterized short protein YbdD (DUF466 family)